MTNPTTYGKGKGIKFLIAHMNYDGPDCLPWPYARLPTGYGFMGYKGKIWRANRLMCQLVNGPPPTPRHESAHTCGHGHDACVHPKHLVWKTGKQNQADRKKHGTVYRRGRQNKLTAEAVRVIRSSKLTQQQLADKFGVTRENIGQVIRRQTWRKVA